MKLGAKLSGGFLIMALLVVISGGFGIYGVSKMGDSVDFITGPAWDAADGAMEGVIGLEGQMLALERIMSGETRESQQAMLDEHTEMAEGALARMKSSGLIPKDQVKALDGRLKDFETARNAILNSEVDDALHAQYTQTTGDLLALIDKLEVFADEQVEAQAVSADELKQSEHMMLIVVIVLGIFMSIAAGVMSNRIIVKPILKAIAYTKRLAEGDLEQDLKITSKDELGELAGSLHVLVGKLREAEEVKVRMVQISTMVEKSGVNMMLADKDFNLIYMNEASFRTLRNFEELLPCRVDEIVGQSIDIFHKNPERIRRILSDPKNLPHSAEIQLGPVTLDFTAIAVMSEQGEHLGNAVSWSDISAQKNSEKEVESLIAASVEGDLTKRADATQFTGFYKTLAEGINQMLDSISSPVTEVQKVIEQLAEGDLSASMTGKYQGVFDEMKTSMNTTVNNLSETIGLVRSGADTVTNGIMEISKGNEDLSSRTSEQASALQETSSSMEEMTATVKQNADNAKQANQLAVAAREVAEKGGRVTSQTSKAMIAVNKSSKKIVDIISVIDEIAFQTNLLALNAAVEAARAGEHGRGFAVVAAEVRNLAQRSATAAKEIKSLINESVQQVGDSTALVDQSSKTLEEIVDSVKRVTDIIGEISAASQEQSTGIDEVNKAIMSMDETTQQNAALVEEATSASQEIKSQARDLVAQVEFFKVTGSKAGRAASREVKVAMAETSQSSASAQIEAASNLPNPSRQHVVAGPSKTSSAEEDEFEEF